MSDIQVFAEQRLVVEPAYHHRARFLRGEEIPELVEAPPVTITGVIEPYSDFQPVRYVSVDPRFIDFLALHRIGVYVL